MQYKINHISDVSRHVFRDLATLWLTIILFTFAAALILSATSAKADIIILPLPKADMVMKPAIYNNFIPSPASTTAETHCQVYLHPQHHHTGSDVISYSGRIQRNADKNVQQTVLAIKAYRQCMGQIILHQLANR